VVVSQWIEQLNQLEHREIRALRCYRSVRIQASTQILPGADPLPDDLRDALYVADR
jgi:hypothetical protein